MLRTLQSNGLIERKEHETDTRAKIVSLTTRSAEVIQKAIEVKTKANAKFLEAVNDKRLFIEELQRLAK